MTVRIAVIVAALAAMAVGGDPAAAQDRMALVVGIDNYAKLSALQKAGNDARAVSSALGKLAFRVDLALDVNSRRSSRAAWPIPVARRASSGQARCVSAERPEQRLASH